MYGHTEYSEDDTLIMSQVERDDIEQEAAILQWSGKTPNRLIIARNLARKNREWLASYFDDHHQPIEWASHPVASQETIDQILEWTLSQSEEIQARVNHFLEDPSEDELSNLLKFLKMVGVISSSKPSPKTANKSVSLRVYILQRLGDKKPHPISDLYELARSYMNSARPEAAVRQTLRRLLKSQEVILIDSGFYQLS